MQDMKNFIEAFKQVVVEIDWLVCRIWMIAFYAVALIVCIMLIIF